MVEELVAAVAKVAAVVVVVVVMAVLVVMVMLRMVVAVAAVIVAGTCFGSDCTAGTWGAGRPSHSALLALTLPYGKEGRKYFRRKEERDVHGGPRDWGCLLRRCPVERRSASL